LAATLAVAVALTWWLDAILLHRVANGSDHAVRLAAIDTYVGVDSWYTLARACGITALVCAYASVLLGLVGQSRPLGSPGRGPGLALHRYTGLLTLTLAGAHALVPYLALDPPYGGWRTGFLPFAQPVSWGIQAAAWESLGILAFYLLLITGPTYYLMRRRPRAWASVHRLTAVLYGLAVAHTVLLGTDFIVSGPARVAILIAQIPLLLLAARRLVPRPAEPRRALRWSGAVLAAAGSAAMAALAVLVAAGDYSPGMRL
jgi:predicted ferric reductase